MATATATKAAVLNSNVLKSESAWDTIEDHHLQQQHQLVKQAVYNNPNEATGLLFVKCKSQGHIIAFLLLDRWKTKRYTLRY